MNNKEAPLSIKKNKFKVKMKMHQMRNLLYKEFK